MKNHRLKPAVIGASIGLADGLLFVTCIHTSLDFLFPFLIFPSIPCWFVAQMLAGHLPASLEWLAWTAGVLTMGLIGAAVGSLVGRVMALIRKPLR